MHSRKIRTLITTAAAALAVAIVPATSQALTAKPTGNKQLDSYCSEVAALINKAMTEANLATLQGDDEGSDAWWALVVEMVQRSQARGCVFGARKVRRVLSRAELGTIKTPSEPTIGTAPEGSTGVTSPRAPDLGSPTTSDIKIAG